MGEVGEVGGGGSNQLLGLILKPSRVEGGTGMILEGY